MIRETTRIDADTIEKLEIDNGVVTKTRIYDPTRAFEYAKNMKENAVGKDMRHVASIPMEIIEHWKVTEGFDWFKASDVEKKARLMNPDNQLFRVWEGSL